MAISRLLRTFVAALLALHVADAYIIDAACTGPQRQAIQDAVNEALGITKYAAFRIDKDKGHVDAFRKQMIGENGNAVDVYTRRMNGLGNTVGSYTSAPFVDDKDRGKDATILFRCGDAAAKDSSKRSGYWYDKDFKNRFPLLKKDGANAVCNGALAMTANTKKKTDQPDEVMPHHIIYLCPRAFQDPSVMGTEWKTKSWASRSVERTAKYLSGTVLHEILHAQEDITPILPAPLPSGAQEAYNFAAITALNNDDKLANAHSHTLLATVSYINEYEIGDSGKFAGELIPGEVPPMTGDPHPQ